MAKFDKSLKYMLRFEGGFFYSKYDSGSKTKYGITEFIASQNGYVGLMENLPLPFAKSIYEKKYWYPLSLDNVNQKTADIVFDMAVNAGVSVGAKCFQNALNIINVVLLKNDGLKLLYDELVVDGRIGLKTLDAYEIVEKRNELKLLDKWINIFKAEYYKKCALNNSHRTNNILTQKGFIRSWSRRIN